MQKHMDLYLIDLLQQKKLDQVLHYIKHPKRFYEFILYQLIGEKVPDVNEEWKCFVLHMCTLGSKKNYPFENIFLQCKMKILLKNTT